MPLILQDDQEVPTEDITVLSSPHGRLRRSERRIDKQDLQAAVKYGLKIESGADRKTGRPRWRYEYGDIVYITDEFSRKEITSWQQPVKIEPLLIHDSGLSRTQRISIQQNPSSVTSHVVCVVDQSGSMRKHDVGKFGSRSETVYTSLALYLVKQILEQGKQLEPEVRERQINVVSVVEMRDEPEVVFEAELLDEEMFNKFLRRRDEARSWKDGNYLPSLAAAEKLLHKFPHGGCALQLLFLSDGKPSDLWTPGSTETATGRESLHSKHEALMRERVRELTRRFGKRLTVGTIGFADEKKNFGVLQGMADEANSFSKGMFLHARSDLGFAISSLVTSLTDTMTEMTSVDGSKQRTVRDVTREKPESSETAIWDLSDVYWYIGTERWMPDITASQKFEWKKIELQDKRCNGLVVRKSILGEGAERMVYGMYEACFTYDEKDASAAPSRIEMIGEPMVAKESRFVEDNSKETLEFHKVFAKTQATAQRIAEAFNAKVAKRAPQGNKSIPRLEFLTCTTYLVEENDGSMREVLAEKRLDVKRYKKFNNNGGHVLGQDKGANMLGMLQRNEAADYVIEEEDEGEDEEDDAVATGGAAMASILAKIVPEDVPQAFSHFSYEHSKKKMLVCDLQGVLDSTQQPHLFELTDPVIHYASQSGRANVYGRTDKGKKGMNAFFRTHKCNGVCELLKLVSGGGGEPHKGTTIREGGRQGLIALRVKKSFAQGPLTD
eukprot:CAMPEP_0169443004 /NCGR_PEP_ID=MMETSP1042-20121227/9126_1 /TAXON_ID=464988 /ORGANISM="Hemiselmis andersenii, Strain CCMP1180" /LENGTH=724 /DNA_ID=CAMNT_0009554207 /DNA_START=221 /DNA_END=2396 /DNA_ORIENTATION=+